MSVLLAVLLSLVYLYLARFYQERVDSWLLGVGWALILLNLLRAGLGALYRWDRQPFERFDVGLEDDRARPGEAFRLEIVLRARRSLSLTRVAAQLRCIDQKVTTRGWVEKPCTRRSTSYRRGCRSHRARVSVRNRASRASGRADNVQGLSGADSLDHFSRR